MHPEHFKNGNRIDKMNKRQFYSLSIIHFMLWHGAAGAAQYGRDVAQMASLQAAAAAINGPNAPQPYVAELPIHVNDPTLGELIKSGHSSTTVEDLAACARIYPNGKFVWGVPTVGGMTTETCVAEVVMKTPQKGQQPGGATDQVLAIAHVPAGSNIKCNISDFPEAGYQPAAGEVEFPADNPPTPEDVEAVMNREQKQNAGIKAATAALIGGAGMFLASGGLDGGIDAKKIGATAAGAAGAGGLAFASTQAGKVAGDTIMSAGMNAAAGAAMGNMGAGMGSGGDAILLIKPCLDADKKETGQKCLWGFVRGDGKDLANSDYNDARCYINKEGKVLCPKKKPDGGWDENSYTTATGFFNVQIAGQIYTGYVNAMNDKDWAEYYQRQQNVTGENKLKNFKEENGDYVEDNANLSDLAYYALINTAKVGGKQRQAMIKNYNDGMFGKTMKDYNKDKGELSKDNLVGRNSDGSENSESATALEGTFAIDNFTPLTIDASDGDVIDFQNKARIKGTAIGGASGAAMGALASYQGARAEIEERYWVEFERYEGTLRGFYCSTGTRPLGNYNEQIIIPAMVKPQ